MNLFHVHLMFQFGLESSRCYALKHGFKNQLVSGLSWETEIYFLQITNDINRVTRKLLEENLIIN